MRATSSKWGSTYPGPGVALSVIAVASVGRSHPGRVTPVRPHRERPADDRPGRDRQPSARAPRVGRAAEADLPGLGQPERRQRLAELDEPAVTRQREPRAAEEREQRG